MKKIIAIFFGIHTAIFEIVFPRPRRRWDRDRYDCAIVCGYPADDAGEPSETMKERVRKAAELWKKKKVNYIILSGGAVRNEFPESEVMKAYAGSLGVPREYLITEKQSVSTYHNMMYSKNVMKMCGFQNCVVVTSSWHLRKANHYARKFGLDYVMCKSGSQEGVCRNTARCIVTNLHMYFNMFRGYW